MLIIYHSSIPELVWLDEREFTAAAGDHGSPAAVQREQPRQPEGSVTLTRCDQRTEAPRQLRVSHDEKLQAQGGFSGNAGLSSQTT